MNRLMVPVTAALLAVALVGAAACNNESEYPPTSEKEDLARLQAMEAEIDTLVGDAACEKDEDCRAIAFGDKPCGGPWSYKVYSVTSVDTLEVARLVAAYNKFNELLNQKHGWMSDCMVVSEPRVGMIAGRCEAIRERTE